MSKLLDAYFILGVARATALTIVHERYRWLASVYHPDRFTASRKDKAEVEMKRVNDARDTIKQHFAAAHPNSGCQCDCFNISFAPIDTEIANKTSSKPATSDAFHSANSEARSSGPQSARAKQQTNGFDQQQEQQRTAKTNDRQRHNGFNAQNEEKQYNDFGPHQEHCQSKSCQSECRHNPEMNSARCQSFAQSLDTDKSSVGLWIIGLILFFIVFRYGSAW